MEVKTNGLIEGLSGLNGNVVFRTLKNGKVIMAKRPADYEPTDHQRRTGNRMVQAYKVAEDIIANDATKTAIYEKYAMKRNKSVKQAIALDILSRPKIEGIRWSVWNGFNPGIELAIEAIDDHKVVSVRVTVLDNGSALDNGEALQKDFSVEYFYTLNDLGEQASAEILVEVTDYAGNVTSKRYQVADIPYAA